VEEIAIKDGFGRGTRGDGGEGKRSKEYYFFCTVDGTHCRKAKERKRRRRKELATVGANEIDDTCSV